MTALDEDAYEGPAELAVGPTTVDVSVRLAGRFEPIDGRYHWGGRVAPDEAVAALVRAGHRSVTVRVGGGTATAARLSDVDPWGGVRIIGTSTPPWARHA